MTLSEARKLRDEIRAASLRCVVPKLRPRGSHTVRVKLADGMRAFFSRAEWVAYVREQNQRIIDFARNHDIAVSRPSPIEIMIGRACGVQP